MDSYLRQLPLTTAQGKANTLTRTLSLSLSRTHIGATPTHANNPVANKLSLSVSLSHTYTHTHTQVRCRQTPRFLPRIKTHSLSYTYTHSLSHTGAVSTDVQIPAFNDWVHKAKCHQIKQKMADRFSSAKSCFRAIDKDGGGTIDRKEMAGGLFKVCVCVRVCMRACGV